MTTSEIKALACEAADKALNVACLHIQEQMNIPSGDVAALFFSGEIENELIRQFAAYIQTEIFMRETA